MSFERKQKAAVTVFVPYCPFQYFPYQGGDRFGIEWQRTRPCWSGSTIWRPCTQPDQIVWIDGSEAQLEELQAQACATGEMEKLNEEKRPAGTSPPHGGERRGPGGRHTSSAAKQYEAGPTNNWMDP